MKVILKQDIANLGEEGDIKEVAAGYGRNFLLPKGLVDLYSKAAINNLEKKRHLIEKKKEAKKQEAREYRAKIEAEEIEFSVASGEKSRLFGAITAANVVEALAKKGMMVERKKVEVPESAIKSLGHYVVKIKLYGDEVAALKVVVKSSNEKVSKAPAVETKATNAEPEAQV